jgi:hypothetical protein
MSKIGERRIATGSASDHAHKTVSERRCAQELIHALTEAGCIRIFADKKSGKNARPVRPVCVASSGVLRLIVSRHSQGAAPI